VLEQELHAQIKTAWDRFEHCTCNLLAYVSQAYPEGTPDLFNACLRRIDTFQQDPSTISHSAEQVLGYNDASPHRSSHPFVSQSSYIASGLDHTATSAGPLSSETPIPSSVGPLILPVVPTTLQRLLVLSPAKLQRPCLSVIYTTISQRRRLQRVSLQILECRQTSSVILEIVARIPCGTQTHNAHSHKYRWQPLPRRLGSK
jgi:hypothetical protein